MATTQKSRSAKIRASLDHPVIDADGHISELTPVLVDYIRQIGGGGMAERYTSPPDVKASQARGVLVGSHEERRDGWVPMGPWWGAPNDARDRATVMVPRLLNERLDEFGIDYTILYPSQGLFTYTIEDDELRRVACRAFNTYAADLMSGYEDRMTPVAAIPMNTPQEAIEELEHAVNNLGFKAVVLGSSVRRAIPCVQREFPEAAGLFARMELFAMDSDYDYDPVWAKCLELKVTPTSHGSVLGRGNDDSISNYVYNHIGLMGMGHLKLCKALFMGGVTRRFPDLKFAFLEGGVSWACGLYADLIGHWEKRNSKAIHQYDPSRLDRKAIIQLLKEYGDEKTRDKIGELFQSFERAAPRPEVLDDFAACGIEKAEDIRDLFVSSFYFGCEADDPMNAMAYNQRANPFGARLRTVFGSDIGHWDVPVMNRVVEEAYELVEQGAITDADFRDFTFTNPASLHIGMNPDFFKGTRVEGAVDKLLQEERNGG